MILAIIILFILFFLSWVLFMPLVIEVDSDNSVYQVYQRGTFRFWISGGFKPSLKILGISIPLKKKEKKPSKPRIKKTKTRKPFSWQSIKTLIKSIYNSIRIRRFNLDVDTDDVVMNAQMVPALMLLSRGPVQLTTNYLGRVYCSVLAEVKLYRISWALLVFFTHK